MAILVRLDELLYAQRTTLTELSERVGITIVYLSILKTGKARAIRFPTLEAIYDALKCQPGDILEFRSGADVHQTSAIEAPADGSWQADLRHRAQQEGSA